MFNSRFIVSNAFHCVTCSAGIWFSHININVFPAITTMWRQHWKIIFIYEIIVGRFIYFLWHTKKQISVVLSIFYKACLKVRKCFILRVLGFFVPKLPSCLMTLLCGLKLGWQIVSKGCDTTNNGLLSTRNLLNWLPKASVLGPAYLASGRQKRNSVLMKCTNDTKLQMAAGDYSSWHILWRRLVRGSSVCKKQ